MLNILMICSYSPEFMMKISDEACEVLWDSSKISDDLKVEPTWAKALQAKQNKQHGKLKLLQEKALKIILKGNYSGDLKND